MQNYEIELQETTKSLFGAIWLDLPPSPAAAVDFGINSQEKYNAIYYAIRNGDLYPEQLEMVSGDGRKITELVNSVEGCNPHGLVFRTSWDVIYGRCTQQELDESLGVTQSLIQAAHRSKEHGREQER